MSTRRAEQEPPARRGLPRGMVFSSALLALGGLGGKCNGGGQEDAPGPEAAAPAGSERPVDEIPAVDVSELTSPEKDVWLSAANDAVAPCAVDGAAGPSTVARCALGEGGCANRCVGAARYLARLVREGYDRDGILAFYDARYGPDGRAEIDLDDAPVRGAPMAPITIVEFSDFECPFCGRAAPILEEVISEFHGEVKLAFFHFPLSMHPRAAAAARATVAAQNQGKFWEMHDLIFQNQTALERSDLEAYATRIGLDLDRFRADLDAPETQRRVEADRAQGERLGVDSTPTLFVNGRKFLEAPESLKAYLREELAR